MDLAPRERRFRRRRMLVALAGVGLMAAAFALCVVLRHGIDGLVYFFTTPTMEAKSGRKYTPITGTRRAIEKLDEKSGDPK